LEIARKTLPGLFEEVKSGAHIVITKDEEPVAEPVPVSTPEPKPVFGSAKGLIKMADDFDGPLEDFKEYMK